MPRAGIAAVAGVVVAASIGVPVFVGTLVVKGSDERNYENSIAACERGNPLRSVVFHNTQTAVEQAKDPQIEARFQDSLDALLAVPGVNPTTGTVDCDAVVQRP